MSKVKFQNISTTRLLIIAAELFNNVGKRTLETIMFAIDFRGVDQKLYLRGVCSN